MQLRDKHLQVHQIDTASQYQGLRQHPRLPKFDAGLLASHRTDTHWCIVDNDFVEARCSLWWRQVPSIPDGNAGLIGHYAAANEHAAAALLEQACQQLSQRGCTFAIGPMDQNTWRDYRFVVDAGDRPRFFLEPETMPQRPIQWRGNGFTEIASYCSGLVEDLTFRCPRLAPARERMDANGIKIRTLDRKQLEPELKKIYSVVRSAFKNNPFYVPISEADFLEMYHPLGETIPTDLILVAEDPERVIGFIFAVPDLLQAKRGLPIDTVVVKTFGVLSGRAYAGVGQVLLEKVHQLAARAGFQYAIHALVRESAPMIKIVERYGIRFRRYALFGKELG